MTGNKIDTRKRTTPIDFVEIGTTLKAQREFGEGPIKSTPIIAYTIAKSAIPLGPQRRKITDLIAPVADIPGFRNQLDLVDNGVLLDDVEEGGPPVDLMIAARKHCCEIEPETIDV